MDDQDISLWSKSLLLKIHMITGWTIPSTEEFVNILREQFTKFLQEKYGDMNPEEIEYAFRSRGTIIEDWGKSMNLNLIDKVLGPYLDERYKVSESERLIAYYKYRPAFDFKNDISWREMINTDYHYFLYQNRIMPYPDNYYQVMEEDGFFDKGMWRVRYEIYSLWKKTKKKQIKEFNDPVSLKEIARARTVLQVFRLARKRGYADIYTKTKSTQ